MATQPFNPDATVPADSDPIVNFPAAERTFRDIVESWILAEHGRSGHHTFLFNTTAERDADSTWDPGAIVFNETLNCLQVCVDDDPSMVWHNVGFEAGTRLPFQQTTPPTGWTKESNAAYNDALMVGTTGSVGTSGTTATSSVLTSRTIAEANLPNVTKTVTGNVSGTFSGSGSTDTHSGHAHSYDRGQNNGTSYNNTSVNAPLTTNSGTSTGTAGAHSHAVTVSGSISASFSSGVTAALGSGTAMDFDAKRFTVTIGQKAAFA